MSGLGHCSPGRTRKGLHSGPEDIPSARRFREPYETTRILCPFHIDFRCSFKGKERPGYAHRWTTDVVKTIYTRDVDHNSNLSPALLRTNKEVRGEAHPFFYQANTFFFYSMTAVIPLLNNRTPESLATGQHQAHRLPSGDRRLRRAKSAVCLNWVCTFREVGCVAGSNLQNLGLRIKGRRCGPSSGGWWATNGLDWVYGITRISGLRKFYNAKLEQCSERFRHISRKR